MATKKEMSRMSVVDLRECWSNEAQDFTPWLAEKENIAQLADVLGFDELIVKAQEEHVGPFRADILCEEAGTGKYVLIENQLERTDHSHLGQILTYAAGLDAVNIIWIAERFTEEHRAAIDWLNRITDTDFNFFGIEIKVFQIENSRPAPMFDIIAKPNGWSKGVHKSVVEGYSDIKLTQKSFWDAFHDYMTEFPSRIFHLQSPRPQAWMTVRMGSSNYKISLVLNSQAKTVSVRLEMQHDAEKGYFDALIKHKDKAEASIGSPLVWSRLEGKNMSHVSLTRSGNFMEESTWPELFAWFRTYTESFITTFRPLIKRGQ